MKYAILARDKRTGVESPLDYGMDGEPEPHLLLIRNRIAIFETSAKAEDALKVSLTECREREMEFLKHFDYRILACREKRAGDTTKISMNFGDDYSEEKIANAVKHVRAEIAKQFPEGKPSKAVDKETEATRHGYSAEQIASAVKLLPTGNVIDAGDTKCGSRCLVIQFDSDKEIQEAIAGGICSFTMFGG